MKKLAITCLVGLLLVVLAAPAWADFQAGLAAYKRGDYATALKEWRPLAERGDINAQLGMGFLFDQGTGVYKDCKKSGYWFRKAAEQGQAIAQYRFGSMYGEGLPKDFKKAVYWYRKAAEQGFANACAESFFHTLKVELVHGESFATREAMRRAVFEYIEVDYNRTRRHSANGYIGPMAFETKMAA